MVCDLFLKSWPQDYAWAQYLCRSIDKFCHGFRRIVIVAPDDKCPRPNLPSALVVQPEYTKPYLAQQAHKLYADTYTDAEMIVHVDSDCVFTRPVQPESFLRGGKVMWLMTPWDALDLGCQQAWLPVMKKFIGQTPTHEMMRRHPQAIPRWLYAELRGFCIGRHDRTLWNYIMAQDDRAFSEFNCAGFYAFLHHQKDICFLDTTKDQFEPDYVRQHWSWGGLKPETRDEIERLLAA